jgi:hypothetical protein
MPILTTDFNDLVKNAKVQWDMAQKEFPAVRSMIADIKSVTEKTSEYSSISQLPTARRKGENDNFALGAPKQGYTTTFNQTSIGLEADVTYMMRKFDKYDEIMKRIRGLAKSVERRMELDVASYLAYAWATSFTNIDGETVATVGADGLALISPSHTVNGSASTFSNQIDTTHLPISPAVLESLAEKFNNFIDDDGRLIPLEADTIISSRHMPTVHEIRRILDSQLLAGTANNDVNTFKGGYKHVIVPFLDMNMNTEARDATKSKYVFLASTNKDDLGFKLEVSENPRLITPEQVFETQTWQFGAQALYDFGLVKSNFIVGTKGDSTSV